MGTVVVAVDGLAQAVHDLVAQNIEENEAVMREDVKRAGDAAVKYLRNNAPYDPKALVKRGKNKGKKKKRLKHYRSGWTSYFSNRLLFTHMVTATVATKVEPSLTHLLEFGHAMFVHGHDTGRRVPAYPHIRIAYDIGKKVLEAAKVDN